MLTCRFTPKEYAQLIGHTESYVRQYRMPETCRNDPDAFIVIQVPMAELLDISVKTTFIGSDERRS